MIGNNSHAECIGSGLNPLCGEVGVASEAFELASGVVVWGFIAGPFPRLIENGTKKSELSHAWVKSEGCRSPVSTPPRGMGSVLAPEGSKSVPCDRSQRRNGNNGCAYNGNLKHAPGRDTTAPPPPPARGFNVGPDFCHILPRGLPPSWTDPTWEGRLIWHPIVTAPIPGIRNGPPPTVVRDPPPPAVVWRPLAGPSLRPMAADGAGGGGGGGGGAGGPGPG